MGRSKRQHDARHRPARCAYRTKASGLLTIAYSAAQWTVFGAAIVGAGAVLCGLVFVSVSMNLDRILAHPTLPVRAWQTLFLLMSPLLIGIPRCARSIQHGPGVGTDRGRCRLQRWSGGARSYVGPIGEGRPIAHGGSSRWIGSFNRPSTSQLCLHCAGGSNLDRTRWRRVVLAAAQCSVGLLLRVD